MQTADTLEVGWVQISEKRLDYLYLPYSVALLQAYAQAHARDPQRYRFRIPLCTRLGISEALAQLRGVHLAGFSTYIWNIQRSLAIAAALKAEQPETLVIFGGPQVPARPEEAEGFLRAHPQVDVLVHGEGERVFLQLLEAFPDNNWEDIQGLAWLDRAGQFHQHAQGPRLPDLSAIPSPFLEGVFAPLMAAYPDVQWVATWETNRGCPFSCSFCDWGGLLQSKIYRFDLERLLAEAEWFGEQKIANIFVADANFGLLPRDTEIAQHMVAVRQRTGYPLLFQTQIAKNVRLRNFEVHRTLAESALNPVVSLSLQSLHPPVLEAIRRQNISLDVYAELQTYCQQHALFCYTDIIIGLPEETYDSFAAGIGKVIEMGQHARILFHNASILPNAEMGDPAYRERYGLETIEMPFPGQERRDDVAEKLEIVVAAHSFDRRDWQRMQIYSWMTHFLYYSHKTLQPIFLVLHHQAEFGLRELLEGFCQVELLEPYPVLRGIYTQLENLAATYAYGKTLPGNQPLLFSLEEGKNFTPDMMIQNALTQLKLWPAFFRQAKNLLMRQLYARRPDFAHALFEDAYTLSQAHFYHQAFGQKADLRLAEMQISARLLTLRYNLWDFYTGCLQAQPRALRQEATRLVFDMPHDMPLL
ncbi:MAG: B12-binding domain-containing radical SAM protein [Candidatus Sericytochromatia bacterium]